MIVAGRADHRADPEHQPDHHADRRRHALRAVLDQRDARRRTCRSTSSASTRPTGPSSRSPTSIPRPSPSTASRSRPPPSSATPTQADWLNGIQDAIITISPRSALNLAAGVRTITISGKTLASSPLPNETWTGSASVTVTGSSSSGNSSSLVAGSRAAPCSRPPSIRRSGPLSTSRPSSQLSAYNYAPIPLSVALQQYRRPPGLQRADLRLQPSRETPQELPDHPRAGGDRLVQDQGTAHLRQQPESWIAAASTPASPTSTRTRRPRSAASTRASCRSSRRPRTSRIREPRPMGIGQVGRPRRTSVPAAASRT